MNDLILLLGIGATALLGSSVSLASDTQLAADRPVDELTTVISALDVAAFDAFNNCSSPEQLEKHATYFAPDVEFYHDTGGVTWNRQDMIASTRFCQFSTGTCKGMADFVILWQLKDGNWQITRVLSYGHRATETSGS